MASGDEPRSTLNIPQVSKAVKATMVGPVGILVYDVTANKLSIKTNAATAIGSWELVTSVADA
jgi:hypothetical protein